MARSSSSKPDLLAPERALLARGIRAIAGVDEAGRGPLAGPVVAAAVVFCESTFGVGLPASLAELNDSKQLTAGQRDRLFETLQELPEVRFGIAVVEPGEIDRVNILQATHRAMARAIAQLDPPPEHLLVDGLPVRSLAPPQTALVKGDSLSCSIAAASVLAKVTRDRLMVVLDAVYPGYGFAQHKGYPTPAHLEALSRLGPCPIHRRSFAPVRGTQLELL
ncbi:MAG: ribonuclease HII [Verrucomicrobiales bacterium]|nr:ribonuclease HII [Verrucomicrobiales bacterium]